MQSDEYGMPPERQDYLEPLLKPDDVAVILGIDVKKVLLLAKRHEIPHIEIGDEIRFSKPVLAAWIKNPQYQYDEKKLLTTHQAAKFLGICYSTMQQLVHDRKISFITVKKQKDPTKRQCLSCRFSMTDLQKYIDDNRVKSVKEALKDIDYFHKRIR
ncbi:MAG: helix-turn-helix domain-containing protein [Deltaproteobacteria bacterium]|jgi:excisionase family DNA binding protein|nr:helix-turn-helix domain-containing protein [Deltaproteobacteria bacterium]